MSEWKDKRLKYVELPNVFFHRANDVDLTSKQHLRYCHKLAQQLAGRKAKNAEEFEKMEAMKHFVLKSAELNEKMIALLDYVKGVLTEIAEDVKPLCQDSMLHDQLRDQSETIVQAWKMRDELINLLYAEKRAEFRSN